MKNLLISSDIKQKKTGINVVTVKESYTSKCSALDKEEIKRHSEYKGKRIKRGLFRTCGKFLLNADVNGSLNILRKVVGDDFINLLDIGCVLQPKIIQVNNF